jgi:hypothetical protein
MPGMPEGMGGAGAGASAGPTGGVDDLDWVI